MLDEADIDKYLASGESAVDWRKKISTRAATRTGKKRESLKHVSLHVPPIVWVRSGDAAKARGIPLYVWAREALARQVERDLGIPADELLVDAPPAKRDYGKTAWERAKEAEDAAARGD